MIADERIKILKDEPFVDGSYVLYWMQSSQRTEYNHALEFAIQQANRLKKPLIVYFGLTASYPEANERHYRFMLEGLQEIQSELAKRKIKMLLLKGSPEIGAVALSSLASLLVVDRGYVRIEREWRSYLIQHCKCPITQVESNTIVPIETVSGKEEYSAATIRPKLYKLLDYFIIPLKENELSLPSINMEISFDSFSIDDIDWAINQLDIDRTVKAVTGFKGGTREAKKRLKNFISHRLPLYGERKNNPDMDYTSSLSPYLHFGHISPLYIVLQLLKIPLETKKEFLEELIIRRELSFNFVFYNEQYDSFEALPAWAKNSLVGHLVDGRDYLYSSEELEKAKTHDPYWNAAQVEMLKTGRMHGYMRMYWGKKILEWSPSPMEAYERALYLNNKYCLDGRDPNSFAGVAWCFGKHDRPWKERNIFGLVRYMNANGLKRKFDMEAYVKKIASL